MKSKLLCVLLLLSSLVILGNTDGCDSSDDKQRRQNEEILDQATSSVGMPAIKNFRERRMLKDILELRDQDGIATYTYTFSEFSGKLTFFCSSIGYGIPYATQFTNPQKMVSNAAVMAQADPNGLFAPASAEGTWVICKDPKSDKTSTVYVEPRVVVSPFKLTE